MQILVTWNQRQTIDDRAVFCMQQTDKRCISQLSLYTRVKLSFLMNPTCNLAMAGSNTYIFCLYSEAQSALLYNYVPHISVQSTSWYMIKIHLGMAIVSQVCFLCSTSKLHMYDTAHVCQLL